MTFHLGSLPIVNEGNDPYAFFPRMLRLQWTLRLRGRLGKRCALMKKESALFFPRERPNLLAALSALGKPYASTLFFWHSVPASKVSWKPKVIEVAAPPLSKELKKRWSYFIRKVNETDPLTCPRRQGEMRIISFIDQPEVIKKILQHLGLWEESHAPSDRGPPEKEIVFDPSYSQII